MQLRRLACGARKSDGNLSGTFIVAGDCIAKGRAYAFAQTPQRESDILRHFVTCLGLAASLLLTGYAWAQPAGAPQTGAAGACTRIVADAARLACYDAAFGRAAAGATTPDRPPGSRPAAASTTVPQPVSGAAAPEAVRKFGDYGQLTQDRKARSDVPKSVTAQITQLSSLPNGLFRLTLDNQQSWQTTQADWALSFKAGDRVQISRLPLGGYQVSVAGNSHSVGAKRMQ
jgi:hypothetical protein